jgi:hypothetical protein
MLQHLRVIARGHVYAGIRIHMPGRKPSNANDASWRNEAKLYDASWEPLVSREVFWTVQRILDDPARVTARPGRANHLLSMIARCDVCGDVLIGWQVNSSRRAPSYACRAAVHVRILKDELDELATDVMLGYLAREDLVETIAGKEADHEALQEIRDEVASLRHRIDALADDTSLSERVLGRRIAALERDLADAERREREASTPSALRGLIEPGPEVEARWATAPLEVRRQIAKILLAPEMIGELRVQVSPNGRRVDAEERVRWRRPAR